MLSLGAVAQTATLLYLTMPPSFKTSIIVRMRYNSVHNVAMLMLIVQMIIGAQDLTSPQTHPPKGPHVHCRVPPLSWNSLYTRRELQNPSSEEQSGFAVVLACKLELANAPRTLCASPSTLHGITHRAGKPLLIRHVVK